MVIVYNSYSLLFNILNYTTLRPVVFLSSRVSHLILVDAWGFPERPQPQSQESGGQGSELKRVSPPRWVKALASVFSLFNPLAVIRAAGPWGECEHHEHDDSRA